MLTKTIYIHDSDCDCSRRLRKSALFRMMQSAAVEHTELLGMGRAMTLDRGILWIVASYHVQIHALPCYDDTVTLRTWPGECMHVLFPRYFTMEDHQGNVLIQASSWWMLMNRESRTFVSPEYCGVRIPGEAVPAPLPLPPAVRSPVPGECASFRVPYSYIDMNGHMNNTRYLDVADDLLPEFCGTFERGSITAEFRNEIRLGEEMQLESEINGSDAWICGKRNGPVFKIRLHRD